jgi:hypothetical protein
VLVCSLKVLTSFGWGAPAGGNILVRPREQAERFLVAVVFADEVLKDAIGSAARTGAGER